GLWLMLYAYALRLFFDFSGYSDVAIGIARLLGVTLPENFNRPYMAHNITLFWQSWHMSLSNWVRNYVFSPLTRALMRREPAPSGEIVTLIGHLTTMGIIGLWHGITLPFMIWGLWQGLGLWVHKTWSDRTRRWYRKLKDQPAHLRAWTLAGWLITFHYIALGWTWFALPDAGLALRVLLGLFGVVRG
ncbi:MAG: MBOAT family O-acyltransferase, partial [Anaerolineae bacterium]|nr:MBOAT family O-acyltransferase [Anaerolineae bacterium]